MSPADVSPRHVILLSVAMPGLGQLVQRRWLSAAIHGIGTTVLAAIVLFEACRSLIATFRFALEFADAQASPPPVVAARAILVPLIACIVLYITNVIDVVVTARRATAAPVPTPPPLKTQGGQGL